MVDASSADEFDAVTIAGVAVTVTDDDAAGAAVSETTLTVAEGGSATYTVRLNTQPTSDVVITRNRQRQHGRDGVSGHFDLHDVTGARRRR